MANYPTSLDAFTNPTSVDSLNAPSHSDQHANANDAIEALEAKVGIGTSTAGSATAGHVLVASSGGTTSWTTVGASAISTTGGSAGQYLSAGTAGVAQWADVTAAGLTLISTQDLTGSSGISFTDVVSSTYDNYLILASLIGSSNGAELALRARYGTTDQTSGYYYGGWIRLYNDTTTNYSGNNNNQYYLGALSQYSTAENIVNCNFIVRGNRFIISNTGFDQYRVGVVSVAGDSSASSAPTGFTIYATSGTITGKIKLYGYKKSV